MSTTVRTEPGTRRYRIVETAEYTVEAGSAAEALELFLDYGPEVSEPVKAGGVTDRTVTLDS